MKAGHCHIPKNGRGGGRDHVPIIQRIFTHTKSKNITNHDHIQLIQGIFTQTKCTTDHEHHHVQKPEAVTVTCILDLFIRYCADKTSPKITIPIASMFTEKLLQTFRHFPT